MAAWQQWRRVTIIGCGLIGASFALALRQIRPDINFAGWDSSSHALDEALRRGIIDEVDDGFASVSSRVSSADLIYLAMPVEQIIVFLRERAHGFHTQTIITDAGSTKAEICRAARAHLPPQITFIGGHPVAGSQHSGLKYARADLFAGAPYVLTPDVPASSGVALLREMLAQMGARVYLMQPEEHDRAMAFVSHLPQLLSSALDATTRAQNASAAYALLCGAGYRDMTRLAGSSWSVWRDILATNKTPIGEALDACIARLTRVRDDLRSDGEMSNVQAMFDQIDKLT